MNNDCQAFNFGHVHAICKKEKNIMTVYLKVDEDKKIYATGPDFRLKLWFCKLGCQLNKNL